MRNDVWFGISPQPNNRLHAFEMLPSGDIGRRMSLCGHCWSNVVSRPIDINVEKLSANNSLCYPCLELAGVDKTALSAWKLDDDATVAREESAGYGWSDDGDGAVEHIIKGELTLCGKMYPLGVARYEKPEKPDMLCGSCVRIQQIAIYTGAGRFVSFNGKYLIWAQDVEIEVDESEVYAGGPRRFRVARIEPMPPRSPIRMSGTHGAKIFTVSDDAPLMVNTEPARYLVPQNPLKGVVIAAPAPLKKPESENDGDLPPGMKEYLSTAVGLMAGKLTESRPELLPGDAVYFDRMGALEIPGLENLWIVEGHSILFQDREVTF